MRRWLLTPLTATVLSVTWSAHAASAGGAQVALTWLAIVDHGSYAESWTASGALFRSNISDAEWLAKIKPTRKPLGPVMSRRLTSEKQATSLPGVPDGQYDVLTFSTEFAAKHDAVETVVLADEPGGWKVDGYFIR